MADAAGCPPSSSICQDIDCKEIIPALADFAEKDTAYFNGPTTISESSVNAIPIVPRSRR
jgi:hypothetical protein